MSDHIRSLSLPYSSPHGTHARKPTPPTNRNRTARKSSNVPSSRHNGGQDLQLSHLPADGPCAELAENYLAMLLIGDRESAAQLVMDAIDSDIAIQDIYLHVFQPSQYEVGRLWMLNQISVAQEHFCTAATQIIMAQLYPRIFAVERRGLSMVAACVGHEQHEVGVRMVADFFEMEGWDTYYLGANVPADALIDALLIRNANLLALSITLPCHTFELTATIHTIRTDARVQHIPIMVGGLPFNLQTNLWQAAGADGHGRDAQEALHIANKLIGRPYDMIKESCKGI